MGYNYDIFISHSSADNKPSDKYHKGWISNLEDTLLNIFEQVFDEKLRVLSVSGNDPSFEQLADTQLFICVLSPEYVNDAQCIEQIKSLHQIINVQRNESIHRRILKVVKQPVARELQPVAIRHLLNYNLLNVDFSNHPLELEAEKEFKVQLADLAYDIRELLKQQDPSRDTVDPGSIHASVAPILQDTVYLAETGNDLLIQRHIIKRELEKQGYKVLPEQKLPTALVEIEATVRRDLEASKLSIHLIGNNNGEILKGTDCSIVEIQNKFAAEHSLTLKTDTTELKQDPAFSQLIWVAPNLDHLNDKQKSFIEDLKKAPYPQATEVLQTSLKDLRMVINERFTVDPKSSELKSNVAADQFTEVYFIYDKVDSQHVKPVIDLFKQHGFNLSLPVFEGEIVDIRKAHIAKLTTFDIAVIYKKQVNEQWLRMKILDLMKAPGYGRKKEALDKVIITESNINTDNSYYTNSGLTLITDAKIYVSELIARILATKQQRNA